MTHPMDERKKGATTCDHPACVPTTAFVRKKSVVPRKEGPAYSCTPPPNTCSPGSSERVARRQQSGQSGHIPPVIGPPSAAPHSDEFTRVGGASCAESRVPSMRVMLYVGDDEETTATSPSEPDCDTVHPLSELVTVSVGATVGWACASGYAAVQSVCGSTPIGTTRTCVCMHTSLQLKGYGLRSEVCECWVEGCTHRLSLMRCCCYVHGWLWCSMVNWNDGADT